MLISYYIYMKKLNLVQIINTAGGRIRCARCTAQSSRTKLQCGRPALKTSKTQKCQFHGGGQTSGKQTLEGLTCPLFPYHSLVGSPD